jgi:hypothetical protein
MIAFNCPGCKRAMNTSDENAGKRCRCPGCNTVSFIPAPTPMQKPKAKILDAEPVEEEEEPPRRQPVREKVEEFDFSEEPPRGRSARDEDDRPRRRRYEEDEDDRPRRRRYEDDEDEDDFRIRPRYGRIARCPNCRTKGQATKVTWTWWGGFIGPLIINTVRCNRCGTHYNGDSGDYNGGRIAIYVLICMLIPLAIGILRIMAIHR